MPGLMFFREALEEPVVVRLLRMVSRLISLMRIWLVIAVYVMGIISAVVYFFFARPYFTVITVLFYWGCLVFDLGVKEILAYLTTLFLTVFNWVIREKDFTRTNVTVPIYDFVYKPVYRNIPVYKRVPVIVEDVVKQVRVEEEVVTKIVTLFELDPLVYYIVGVMVFLILVQTIIIVKLWKSWPVPLRVSDGYIPEKMVEGSTLIPMRMPDFVAEIFVKMSGRWYKSGVGFRTSEGFFTAAHVVDGADEVELRGLGGKLKLSKEDFEEVKVGDCVVYKEPIGWLKCAKFARALVGKDRREMVMATDGTQCSVGSLMEAGFGKVSYEGSTLPGFSGSPYFMHRTVFGMHVGAGKVNLGICGAFISFNASPKPESSEDFVLDVIKRGGDYEEYDDPYDPDGVFVKVKGKYFRMDYDDFYSAREMDTADRIDTQALCEQYLGHCPMYDYSHETAKPDIILPPPTFIDDPPKNLKTGPAGPTIKQLRKALRKSGKTTPTAPALTLIGKSSPPQGLTDAPGPSTPTIPETALPPTPTTKKESMEDPESTAAPKSAASVITYRVTGTQRESLEMKMERQRVAMRELQLAMKLNQQLLDAAVPGK